MISVDRLRELLSYDPCTGVLIWKIGRGGAKKGAHAGFMHKSGYRNVMVCGEYSAIHRIAWAIYYGEYPHKEIDHINGVKTDNRIINLRDVDRSENMHNQSIYKNSKAGLLGVRKSKTEGKWEACVTFNRVKRYIGTFETVHEAHNAYANAKNALRSSK